MSKANRLRFKEIVWCALAAVGIGILVYFSAPLFAAWENIILDWHLQQTFSQVNPEKIVLILGGDQSMVELDSWPWPRETHARLIGEQLTEAKVIAYDVFLVDKTTQAQDDLLAQAISGHGNVVLGNAYRSDGVLLQPLEHFRENATTGYFNFYPDSDYVVRRYTLAKRADYGGLTEITPSFVLAVLEAAGFEPLLDSSNRLHLLSGGQEVRLDQNLNVFKLPVAGDSYPVYEFSDVLSGQVPPEVFKDAIVFVGISATGASDIVHTSTGYITGTRALADVFYSLLSQGMPYPAAPIHQILFAACVALICLAGTLYLPSRLNWLSLVVSILLVVAVSHTAFRFAGVYLQAAPLCVMLLISGVLQLIYLRVVRENRQRQEMLMNMIACFVSAIDAKDPVTAGHSQRVSEVAVQIATQKGLKKKDIENIRLAGLIHDIGKIGISDAVLNKPGKFTPEEYDEMKRHPQTGARIMEQARLPAEIVAGIIDHHERPDGNGYPAGKTGSELHLFAEIIKIADVYDALSSKRQYKDPWPIEKVCAILYEGRGSEFDAELTDLFLKDIQSKQTSEMKNGGSSS